VKARGDGGGVRGRTGWDVILQMGRAVLCKVVGRVARGEPAERGFTG